MLPKGDIHSSKKPIRSRVERRVAAVCGGLAEHFDVDPLLVRAGFVVFALCACAGIWPIFSCGSSD
ncbi:PspC domain-containing protein [Candidatus Bipolaricaulota bacterium]